MGTISNGESGLSVRNKLNDVIDKIEGTTDIGNNILFGDNSKAIFGAGSDLQIYHTATGNHSVINESGGGDLQIQANKTVIQSASGADDFLVVTPSAGVQLSHNASGTVGVKLATTSTGVDITGTLTSDGLTVDGSATLSGGNLTHTLKTTTSSSTSQTTLLFNNRDGNGNYHDVASIVGRSAGNGGSGDIVFNTQYSGTGIKTRMEIDRTGDISFYEDTGTTAKFFWDASAESLGIGTSSPARLLDVNGIAKASIFDAGGEGFIRGDAAGELRIQSGTTATTFRNNANNAEFMRIDSTGRVNIGPTTGTTGAGSFIAGGGAFYIQSGQNQTSTTKVPIVFSNIGGSSESMRIDSSGNLLVGTTTLSTNTDGHELRADGKIVSSTSGAAVAYFNRNTNDGDIIRLDKDGATVGSIGSYFDYFYIGSPTGTDAFIRFGNSIIAPSTSGGAYRDAAIDLGVSTARFKDLYLSGGVYLGGTGAANLLDDYEEGTWTPNVQTNGFSQSVSSTAGRYVKIGEMVYFEGKVELSAAGTTTTHTYISNFPFANQGGSGTGGRQAVGVFQADNPGEGNGKSTGFVRAGQQNYYITLYHMNNSPSADVFLFSGQLRVT
jgi:hypothetical protein